MDKTPLKIKNFTSSFRKFAAKIFEETMENHQFESLAKVLDGELYFDETMRTLYATDASAYREMPMGVAIPKTYDDLKKIVTFAKNEKLAIIPRAAGTSLAGQVVGNGLVVDISVNFTKILEVNKEEKWVRVETGVIRDELNMHLANFGLFFGPETSTSNRCMTGGMVGNNSCGARSVIYGSTREHLLEIKAILSDGNEAVFKAMSKQEFEDKCAGKGVVSVLEQQIYQNIKSILSDPANRAEIEKEFPKPSIPRRNTGYAIDMLKDSEPFVDGGAQFNFCKLIAGSEGTLCFITEIKLGCVPVLPKYTAMMCGHFNSIDDSLKANIIALKYKPSSVELIDHYVVDCVRENIEQRKNGEWVQGNPQAILMVEMHGESMEQVSALVADMEKEMRAAGFGYYFPVLLGDEIKKALTLRKAGLGLLSNIPGDAKAVPVIEDTAVDTDDLPQYIAEFNKTLAERGLYCVHYAHAGSGELHLRPILNLKTKEGNEMFRTVAQDIATLVKKYKGSLSGEHGDGRLRGEFIKFMLGEKNYGLLKTVKAAWDPNNIFNPGKIVDTPPMNTFLRYAPGQKDEKLNTVFSYPEGILKAAEACNGSADCRKTELSGGTMCPSYMATRNEKDTTRARANILREAITYSDVNKINKFDSEAVKEVMDLCLSCKGCKSECPSNVDIAKLKSEASYQYYKVHGVPFRSRMIGDSVKINAVFSAVPWLYNFGNTAPLISNVVKGVLGMAQERPLPKLYKYTLDKWYQKNKSNNFGVKTKASKGKVIFFNDEFTNHLDVAIGEKTILLLTHLGYDVVIPKHEASGRTYISKGMLQQAKEIAIKNVNLLKDVVGKDAPIIGVEPSAILTLRDEYLDLVGPELLAAAKNIAANTFLVDEFISNEVQKGNITSAQFTAEEKVLKVHGHCHQKSLSSLTFTKRMLSLPKNYSVHMIPSGCCGMAGSFGYEKEHYDISMKIGELVLFPTVRKQGAEVEIVAPGTSCRHQIKDGTGRNAKHTAEILFEALLK